jgi:4-hydroxy-tetrahydrodipicolinate reductase
MELKIAITGAAGRMGRSLIEACHGDEACILGVALERAGHPMLAVDAGNLIGIGNLNVPINSDLASQIANFTVLIDFTTPEATMHNLEICVAAHKAIIIGTTGFDAEQKQRIRHAAQEIPIVFSPNMSIGVNLSFKLIEIAAKILQDKVDIEIIEAHHRHKQDAPSGTALRMGEIVAKSLGKDLQECAIYGRKGQIGARENGIIGFETIRAGDIVGEHTVMFADVGERIEITHKASNRMIYARGALRAAKWLSQYNNGLYDMQDVLGLSSL